MKFTVPPFSAVNFENDVHITLLAVAALDGSHPTVCGFVSIPVIFQPEKLYHCLVALAIVSA